MSGSLCRPRVYGSVDEIVPIGGLELAQRNLGVGIGNRAGNELACDAVGVPSILGELVGDDQVRRTGELTAAIIGQTQRKGCAAGTVARFEQEVQDVGHCSWKRCGAPFLAGW